MQSLIDYTLWPPHWQWLLQDDPYRAEINGFKAYCICSTVCHSASGNSTQQTYKNALCRSCQSCHYLSSSALCIKYTVSNTQPRGWTTQHLLRWCAASNSAMCSMKFKAEEHLRAHSTMVGMWCTSEAGWGTAAIWGGGGGGEGVWSPTTDPELGGRCLALFWCARRPASCE